MDLGQSIIILLVSYNIISYIRERKMEEKKRIVDHQLLEDDA